MTPELWQRIKPLYEAAVAMPEEERARFIAESCHDDSEARAALDEMLRHGLEDTDTLDVIRDFGGECFVASSGGARLREIGRQPSRLFHGSLQEFVAAVGLSTKMSRNFLTL